MGQLSETEPEHIGTLAFISLISTFLLVFSPWADPSATFQRAVCVHFMVCSVDVYACSISHISGTHCHRYVIFFLRAWSFWARTYIKDPELRRRSTLTSETILDVESALSAVINIIAICADGIAGSAWVYIRRLGSDMCEALFARCGGWMGECH
jgi:hypothetical protein